MNYLISSFDCYLKCETIFPIKKNVKYKIFSEGEEKGVVLSDSIYLPFVLDLKNKNENIIKTTINGDIYCFLFPIVCVPNFTTKFRFKSKDVFVNLSNKLYVSIEGVCICEENVENLKFSHYEIEGEFCFIYFTGKRNFFVLIKNEELCFADFYDECNIKDNEKYFMCKQQDSLNHGKVCEVKQVKIDNYLVYLDDEEMQLKKEFVPSVFMDCVKVGNINYAKSLLCEELKSANNVENFFPKFDLFFQIEESIVVLIKKNTLAGVFKFEIENCKISNIIPLHCSSC